MITGTSALRWARLARSSMSASLHTSTVSRSLVATVPTPAASIPPLPVSSAPKQSVMGRPLFIPPAEDPLLNLFTNVIMKHGKRHRAARTVTETLTYIHSITHCPPLPILREAIQLAAPVVKVVSLRKHAKKVPCPRPLTDRQGTTTALRWILEQSKKRPEHSFSVRFTKEIIAIMRSDSEVLKKKEQLHKLATVNRANAPKR